ncbi:hypothetical protein JCM6882_007051 [Rhodosporidiobolus microsporus]
MPPVIDVFVTSILSNPAIRGRHERVKRALTSARVSYAEHDVAGDEAAKSMWKRKNGGKNELPFILVDGEPVGSIEDMDEAVEFGELRQFLRLDSSAPPPPATAPAAAQPPSAPSSNAAPPAAAAAASTSPDPSRAAPTLDDFADLDLTDAELAELARELAHGETFSSGLVGSSHDPSRQGYDFSSATQRFEPVFAPTQPLKFEKVNFQRALPDRPLASDVVRDELDGIDEGELGEDELEKLARELEAEENERRRLRDAQGEDQRGVEPPPLPEKKPSDDGVDREPRLPAKDGVSSPSRRGSQQKEGEQTKSPLAEATSVEGAGGAALSAPLAEVDQLRLSDDTVADLKADLPSSTTVSVAPPSSSADEPTSSSSAASTPAPPTPVRKTSKQDAAQLKSELHKAVTAAEDADPEKLRAVGGSMSVSEMPSFVGKGDGGEQEKGKDGEVVESPKEEKAEGEDEEGTDGLADRVAEAIRGGDL